MLKLYNTLSRKKEEFKSIKKGKVGIYSCGPTVNDVPHLGHAKQQVSFDVLRRYLEFLDYDVKFVSNVTDVEDKIIAKANELGISIEELTEKNYEFHMEDYRALNVEVPTIQPRATDYIPEMIKLVEKLMDKGYAYEIGGDGIYFEIDKFKDYGKLSHQKLKDLREGKRVKNDKKKSHHDFVLWKFSKEGEPKWDSPFGEGRPGWHIECSAMSAKLLDLPFDIHSGGQDLIFPHHEDEIAQSEAGYGKEFVHYWVHNGMVNVEGEKMSKSVGNFKTIRDLLEKYNPMVVRYFVVSSHYRKPVDFTEQALEDAKNSYDRLKRLTLELNDKGAVSKKYIDKFKEEMNDDLNTPRALAVLWELVRDKDAKGKLRTVKKMDEVFGLKLLEKSEVKIPDDVKKITEERLKARDNKDWGKSDELRDVLKEKGWVIKDGKDGYELERS
jgi:cysteinyl-tRNA synthetase